MAVTQDDQRPTKTDLVSRLDAPSLITDTNKERAIELPPVLSIFSAVTPVCQKTDRCAVDWTLKTKVRFTSKSPFAFSSTLKVCLLFKTMNDSSSRLPMFTFRPQKKHPELRVSSDALTRLIPKNGAL